MSTREDPRQLRLASWQQIFADRAASGLSVKGLLRSKQSQERSVLLLAVDRQKKCLCSYA